jgi:hypothetical protein
MYRSEIRQAALSGVRVESGRLSMSSSLLFGAPQHCLWVGEQGEADVTFGTIAGCGTGIELQNPAPGALSLRDSIVFGHSIADLVDVDCEAVVRSATAGECCGSGSNVCGDPRFADPAAGDYRLRADSPCLEVSLDGDAFDGWPCKDRAGRPRLLDGDRDGWVRADMGAHEHEPVASPAPGAILGLRFLDGLTLAWQPDATAVRYLVFRSALAGVDYRISWDCLGATEVLQYPLEGDTPLPGEGFVYVVAGEAAGGQRGSTSAGTCAERSNEAPCP